LNNISYLRYTAEGISVAEFRGYPTGLFDYEINQFLSPSNWSMDDWRRDNLGLLVHGIVTRVCCWMWLTWGSTISALFRTVRVHAVHCLRCGKIEGRQDSFYEPEQDRERRPSEVPFTSVENRENEVNDIYTDATRRNSMESDNSSDGGNHSSRRSSADYSTTPLQGQNLTKNPGGLLLPPKNSNNVNRLRSSLDYSSVPLYVTANPPTPAPSTTGFPQPSPTHRPSPQQPMSPLPSAPPSPKLLSSSNYSHVHPSLP